MPAAVAIMVGAILIQELHVFIVNLVAIGASILSYKFIYQFDLKPTIGLEVLLAP